jgi:hypothetical protein
MNEKPNITPSADMLTYVMGLMIDAQKYGRPDSLFIDNLQSVGLVDGFFPETQLNNMARTGTVVINETYLAATNKNYPELHGLITTGIQTPRYLCENIYSLFDDRHRFNTSMNKFHRKYLPSGGHINLLLYSTENGESFEMTSDNGSSQIGMRITPDGQVVYAYLRDEKTQRLTDMTPGQAAPKKLTL